MSHMICDICYGSYGAHETLMDMENIFLFSVSSIMNQLALETTNTELIQTSPKLTHTNKSKF